MFEYFDPNTRDVARYRKKGKSFSKVEKDYRKAFLVNLSKEPLE